jgi:signal transduction histidine kinase
MMRAVLAFLCYLFLSATLTYATENTHLNANTTRLSLEGRLEHFRDTSNALHFEQIQKQHFEHLSENRSFGYNTDSHWFRVQLNPENNAPSRWVLSIGSAELEEVDVYVQQPNGSFKLYEMGYHRPYTNRPVRTRLFSLAADVFPNMQIYFRVHTTNALNVYADLWQVDAFTAYETRSNFYRGAYFGILLIAVLLYAILGLRLRDFVILVYGGYIASQMLFNLGTNGYLPVLLPLHAEWFTDALPRIGWLGGAACLSLMWDKLLNLSKTYPRLHWIFIFTALLHLILLPFALLPFLVNNYALVAVKIANFLSNTTFFISMVLLLVFWWRQRKSELMIYFIAFVIPAIGALINNATNLGFFSQNVLTSNLYQIAPLIHVLVMSYGLALRLRQLQFDKQAAEQETALAISRSKEQRRFFAMISHEFGNPLAAIDRSVQMIQLKATDLLPSESQRLNQIRNNTAHLSSLVESFLTAEALENNSLIPTQKTTTEKEFLQNCLQKFDNESRSRIQLSNPNDNCPIVIDTTLMEIAVNNLVTNALRYSPPDQPVEIMTFCSEKGLYIKVSDHGSGLPPEDIEKLGTPYFRAQSSHNKKGSGLGYYFTRRIVEAHGGTLEAENIMDAEAKKIIGLKVTIFTPHS